MTRSGISGSDQLELLHGVLNQPINVRDVSVIADHIEPVAAVALAKNYHTNAPFFRPAGLPSLERPHGRPRSCDYGIIRIQNYWAINRGADRSSRCGVK